MSINFPDAYLSKFEQHKVELAYGEEVRRNVEEYSQEAQRVKEQQKLTQKKYGNQLFVQIEERRQIKEKAVAERKEEQEKERAFFQGQSVEVNEKPQTGDKNAQRKIEFAESRDRIARRKHDFELEEIVRKGAVNDAAVKALEDDKVVERKRKQQAQKYAEELKASVRSNSQRRKIDLDKERLELREMVIKLSADVSAEERNAQLLARQKRPEKLPFIASPRRSDLVVAERADEVARERVKNEATNIQLQIEKVALSSARKLSIKTAAAELSNRISFRDQQVKSEKDDVMSARAAMECDIALLREEEAKRKKDKKKTDEMYELGLREQVLLRRCQVGSSPR